MKPITHTIAQLRVLWSACGDPDLATTSMIIWTPEGVYATNAHAMMFAPLPADDDRAFAIEGNVLKRWLDAHDPPYASDWDIERPTISLTIEVGDCAEISLGNEILHVPTVQPGKWLDAGRKIARSPGGDIASHIVDPKYLVLAAEFTRAFVTRGNGMRCVGCAGKMDPVVYEFESEHGNARFVVMPMMEPK